MQRLDKQALIAAVRALMLSAASATSALAWEPRDRSSLEIGEAGSAYT